jgi:hypothetical protein
MTAIRRLLYVLTVIEVFLQGACALNQNTLSGSFEKIEGV